MRKKINWDDHKPKKITEDSKSRSKMIILTVVIIGIISSIFIIEGVRSGRMNLSDNSTIDLKAASDRTAFKDQYFKEKAKELVRPDGYINVDNITIAENIGKKVILVDFWTYSCINCQRTTPYLNDWHDKYSDKGLLIIGVHTPEFNFEKDYSNVQAAVTKYGIKYPVVLDNEYFTWTAYANRYWPRKYLIDIDGYIVYDHIGEGGYEETEKKIIAALEEREKVLRMDEGIDNNPMPPTVNTTDFGQIATPELYLGYGFSRGQMGNTEGWHADENFTYTMPASKKNNAFYLGGTWMNNMDNMQSVSDAKISLAYTAKNVNIVAGADSPSAIKVLVDGEEYADVTVNAFDLYVVVPGEDYGHHTVDLEVEPGVKIYTFTFG